ncbi:hypothetical protein EYW49_12980 [Siculibacillus lacustris]|uniref:Uncharacterized protein n=1 Tax=Siculibacillus lacustris TaxID=1549641 RepID=A0A4Q9VMD6_9HYPH|nr:hypothetical protein [Siculibacillus lacustris]TBW36751.1 hypothetical protein EYW49_12980 [Siculibacillus lacustris]
MVDEDDSRTGPEDAEDEPQALRRRAEVAVPEAVAEYKRILKAVLDVRPSGFRRKLAVAIDRNPSFVSQIINPAYPVPIPAPHIEKIFEVCHLSGEERSAFMAAYTRAHPRRVQGGAVEKRPGRRLILTVPDLGSDHANRQFDAAIDEFVRRLAPLLRAPDSD